MNPSQVGRIAIVIGASSGLGRAIALALAAAGMRLVVTARRGELHSTLCAEIIAQQGGSISVIGDARDEPVAGECVAKALEGLTS